MKLLLCVVLPLAVWVAPVQAKPFTGAEVGPEGGCFWLMTPEECSAHLAILRRLPEGPERRAYLSGYRARMREREQACPCVQAQKPLEIRRVKR
jgi:hypothetical protein